METRPTCKECGAPLAPDAPEGLCPKCLLKVAMGTQARTQSEQGPSAATTGPGALPDPARLAEYFPQLAILELLGQGGMGAVYKARQPGLDRLVALKILPSQAGSDPGFAERFNREARALARLSHPNIVAVYDFGQTHGLHYFIMEYVDGPNLREIERANKLSAREALQIIPQICEALQFAHDEGVVHRDVKPENVLLDKKGRVKIADFGLAKILGREPKDLRLTGARDVVGTPHYMAPEQVEHPQEVDHRADIYSLGVVFYEMLTGELPLGKFALPSQKVQVDVRLDEVVLHTLEKEPSRRYQHASQVKTDVETIANSEVRGSQAKARAAGFPARERRVEVRGHHRRSRNCGSGGPAGPAGQGTNKWPVTPDGSSRFQRGCSPNLRRAPGGHQDRSRIRCCRRGPIAAGTPSHLQQANAGRRLVLVRDRGRGRSFGKHRALPGRPAHVRSACQASARQGLCHLAQQQQIPELPGPEWPPRCAVSAHL